MEYLDGLNLEDLVQRWGPQPEGRVVHILRQVCGSLHEAHGLGLIHRDIKPANIVLNRRGGVSDVVKLLDFGLVKVLDAQKQATLTSAGGITGTPLYLPPEAIENAATVDARSDIYAVGAVGYFLLTGRPVFEGDNVLTIIRQHVQTPPPPPSERLGRPVAADLEQLLLQCLAKSPAARPQSAQQLSAALAACALESAWTEADADCWWAENRPPADLNLAAAQSRTDDGRLQATLLGALPE
jgi:serine/threonine protein kinase